MRLIAATLVTLFVAGCASSPATPTGSLAAPAAAPAPITASKPATASTAKPSATTASKYPGYKTKQKNGQTFYCKKLAQIGSRFEDETCLTEAEMKTLMEQADSDRSMLRRSQNTCTMSGGANGGCGP
jgi:hypothetical protein